MESPDQYHSGPDHLHPDGGGGCADGDTHELRGEQGDHDFPLTPYQINEIYLRTGSERATLKVIRAALRSQGASIAINPGKTQTKDPSEIQE